MAQNDAMVCDDYIVFDMDEVCIAHIAAHRVSDAHIVANMTSHFSPPSWPVIIKVSCMEDARFIGLSEVVGGLNRLVSLSENPYDRNPTIFLSIMYDT